MIKKLRIAKLKANLVLLLIVFSSVLISYNLQKNKIADVQSDKIVSARISSINSNYNNIIKNSYISRAPIKIYSDDDLTVFPGSGTKKDPYIIENYNITDSNSDGIYINGTTKYIIVRNCYLNGGGSINCGINIKFVSYGTVNITNNTIINYKHGIRFESSYGLFFTSNVITNSSYYGIYLESNSDNNTFVSNTVS